MPGGACKSRKYSTEAEGYRLFNEALTFYDEEERGGG